MGNTLAVYSGDATANITWEEQHLYGSSRLGYWNAGVVNGGSATTSWNTPGKTLYELSNHLGNVMAMISGNEAILREADVRQMQDYYPFGMVMPGRSFSAGGGSYRYGFNGQEKSDEINGEGSNYNALFWQYDARLGRRWNIDPKPVTGLSLYATFTNNPILFEDSNGDTTSLNLFSKSDKPSLNWYGNNAVKKTKE